MEAATRYCGRGLLFLAYFSLKITTIYAENQEKQAATQIIKDLIAELTFVSYLCYQKYTNHTFVL